MEEAQVNGPQTGGRATLALRSARSRWLGTLGVSSTAAAINNAGNIVGFYSVVTGGPSNGFLDVGGTITTLDAPGASSTMLLGINNKGLIVGTATDAAGRLARVKGA